MYMSESVLFMILWHTTKEQVILNYHFIQLFFYGYTSNLHWYSTFQYIKNLWVFSDFVLLLRNNLRNIIIIFNMWSAQCRSANKYQWLRLERKAKSLGQMLFLLQHTSHRQLCLLRQSYSSSSPPSVSLSSQSWPDN